MGRSAKRKQFKRQLLREKQFRIILTEKAAIDREKEITHQLERPVLLEAEHLAYSLGDFSKSLEILTPLLSVSEPSLEASLCAFFSATQVNDFDSALIYLDMIKLHRTYGVSLAKIRGDILLRAGKIKEAIHWTEPL